MLLLEHVVLLFVLIGLQLHEPSAGRHDEATSHWWAYSTSSVRSQNSCEYIRLYVAQDLGEASRRSGADNAVKAKHERGCSIAHA